MKKMATQMMTKTYLFPPACKAVGLWLFVPAAVLGLNLLTDWWDVSWQVPVFALAEDAGGFRGLRTDIVPTLVVAALVVSLLLICFSREKDEDEYVEALRCHTLVLAVIASYVALIVGNLLIYGFSFLTFLFVNLFTVLAVYALVFHYRLYRSRKCMSDEE